MTAVADATLIIETILGRTIDNAQLLRIADAFIGVDPYNIANWNDGGDPPLPRNPTNEEKAEHFIQTLKLFGSSLLRERGRYLKREADYPAFLAAVDAEGDNAAADLI